MNRRAAIRTGAAIVAAVALAPSAAIAPQPSRVEEDIDAAREALAGVPPHLVMTPRLIAEVERATGEVQQCAEACALLAWLSEKHSKGSRAGFWSEGVRPEFNAHEWLRRNRKAVAA